MERSAKSAWQAAQRLAEEAEKQRWGCDWLGGEQLLEGFGIAWGGAANLSMIWSKFQVGSLVFDAAATWCQGRR